MAIPLVEIARISLSLNEKKPDPHVEHVRQGLRLGDVAKFVFPEHDTVAYLKKELSLMNDILMMRVWVDNNPRRLKFDFHCLNRLVYKCRCSGCLSAVPSTYQCEFWKMILRFMNHTGITYSFPSSTEGRIFCSTETLSVFRNMLPRPSINTPVVHVNKLIHFTPDPDFDEQKASKYLSPVSEIDVHVVFDKADCVFDFKYGRKLWDHKNINTLTPELAKLDLFRTYLRVSV